jgi:hypothetical protein
MHFTVAAQENIISGIVMDENHKPVSGASVFFSNSSTGMVTGSNGQFAFPRMAAGKYDLVISFIGYETFVKTISTPGNNTEMKIALTPKANELQEVVLEPFEKDGWQKWGKFFLDNFIGTNEYAEDCVIKNKEVIRFRNSKKENRLTAIALEPLIIENKAMGYNIKYQLEEFSYNFKTRYILYTGYPLFQEMTGRKGQIKRWEKNRQEAYYGSIMHFMRALYRNKLVEQDFRVYHLTKVENIEKKRVKDAYRKMSQSRMQQETTKKGNFFISNDKNASLREAAMGSAANGVQYSKDSAVYYEQILRQPDAYDLLDTNLLRGDSIAYGIDSIRAGLEFKNYLQIVYLKKTESPLYLRQMMRSNERPGYATSQITLINESAIEVFSNGVYYNPVNMINSGYWGWSEKISTMLPFNYKPPM